jgi:hypothetical protein
MSPRTLITTIGATALTFGVVIGGAAVAPNHAFAQETATVQADDTRAAFEAERAASYDAFVSSLAADLGSDAAAVDAAIREALKQEIAEQLAADEISEEEAAARAAVIDVADAPLELGHGVGGRGFGGHGFGGHGRDGRGDDDRGFGPPDGGSRGGRFTPLPDGIDATTTDETGAGVDATQPAAAEDDGATVEAGSDA